MVLYDILLGMKTLFLVNHNLLKVQESPSPPAIALVLLWCYRENTIVYWSQSLSQESIYKETVLEPLHAWQPCLKLILESCLNDYKKISTTWEERLFRTGAEIKTTYSVSSVLNKWSIRLLSPTLWRI